MDLPTTCGPRKSLNNCEVSATGFPTCVWNSTAQTCLDKTCATASTAGTTGVLTTFNLTNCQGYLPSNACLLGNDSASC